MNRVYFHYADKKLGLSGKNKIKDAVKSLFQMENKSLDRLDYIFCSDEFLLNINQEFLQHDYFTDIITFDLSESQGISGEIYISLDRVKENASQHNVSHETELKRVIFHGALHLCGYKDKSKKDIITMRSKEDFYLNYFS